jgi:acyl-coenzyme A thioesterase PaaI-like protein
MKDLSPTEHCYGCGKSNPVGLKLEVHKDGQACVARFLPTDMHQGWEGMVHGGVLATLMDEIMGWALWQNQIRAVTGRLSIRYYQPAAIGQEILLRGFVHSRRGKSVETRAEARSADQSLLAEATAICIIP